MRFWSGGIFKVVWVSVSDMVQMGGVGLEKGEREVCVIVGEFEKFGI